MHIQVNIFLMLHIYMKIVIFNNIMERNYKRCGVQVVTRLQRVTINSVSCDAASFLCRLAKATNTRHNGQSGNRPVRCNVAGTGKSEIYFEATVST
jgi:hypothetical protein